MYNEDDGSFQATHQDDYCCGVSLVLNCMSAGRSGATVLILSLIALNWLRHKKLQFKAFVVLVLIFVIMAGTMAILVGKGGATSDISVLDNVPHVLEGLQVYALGGVVAFDQVLLDPGRICGSGA